MSDLKARINRLHKVSGSTTSSIDTAESVSESKYANQYGVVDSRPLQPGEIIVKINQRGMLIEVYFDPMTKNARPIVRA